MSQCVSLLFCDCNDVLLANDISVYMGLANRMRHGSYEGWTYRILEGNFIVVSAKQYFHRIHVHQKC